MNMRMRTNMMSSPILAWKTEIKPNRNKNEIYF